MQHVAQARAQQAADETAMSEVVTSTFEVLENATLVLIHGPALNEAQAE